MAGFSISLQGFKELETKLNDLATKDALRIARDGLRAGGEVIQAAIASRAPTRPDLPSGTALPVAALAHDIGLYIGEEDGLPAAIIRPGSETAYVAEWVEYGHREVKGGAFKRGHGPGKKIGNVPAHPFIRPGFEESAAAAIERTTEVVTKEIEEAAEK